MDYSYSFLRALESGPHVMVFSVFLIFGFALFMGSSNHLLFYLLLLEIFLLNGMFFISIKGIGSAGHMVILFLVLGVSEASLGLALLVKLSRSGESSNQSVLSLLSV